MAKSQLGRKAAQNARVNQGEKPDPTPIEIQGPRTRGYIKVTAEDSIKAAIRQLKNPGGDDQDTFEEADDFSDPDDSEEPIFSQYEMTQMEEDAEFSDYVPPEQEIDAQQQAEESALEEAPEKSADE